MLIAGIPLGILCNYIVILFDNFKIHKQIYVILMGFLGLAMVLRSLCTDQRNSASPETIRVLNNESN